MTRLLRFLDLKDRRIVNSWPQLKRLQKLHGFPLGKLLAANTRVWTEEEIDAYIASRPVTGTPLRGNAKRKHEARKAAESAASE